MRLRHVLSAAAAALLLAACQASASPVASPSPSVVPATSAGALPSFVGAADLEATLPSEAAGLTIQAFSMSGPDFVAGDPEPQFIAFLDSLGADIEEVAVAVALGINADGTQTASILAFQVIGATASDLVDEFKATADEGAEPLVWHPATIGGKAVELSDTNPDFPTPVTLYATGDVLYFVSSTDPDALEEILAFLP